MQLNERRHDLSVHSILLFLHNIMAKFVSSVSLDFSFCWNKYTVCRFSCIDAISNNNKKMAKLQCELLDILDAANIIFLSEFISKNIQKFLIRLSRPECARVCNLFYSCVLIEIKGNYQCSTKWWQPFANNNNKKDKTKTIMHELNGLYVTQQILAHSQRHKCWRNEMMNTSYNLLTMQHSFALWQKKSCECLILLW